MLGAVLLLPSVVSGQESCLACHENRAFLAGLVDSSAADRLAVDRDEFAESIHGRMQFDCTLCHSSIADYPHTTVAPVDCGGCHADEEHHLADNVHGRPHPATGTPPASCGDCHTDHHILAPDDPMAQPDW